MFTPYLHDTQFLTILRIMSDQVTPEDLLNFRLDNAKFVWDKTFSDAPYTSLWMVDYLLKKADLSYEDLLRDPGALKRTFAMRRLKALRNAIIWTVGFDLSLIVATIRYFNWVADKLTVVDDPLNTARQAVPAIAVLSIILLLCQGRLAQMFRNQGLAFDSPRESDEISSRPGRCTSFAIQTVKDFVTPGYHRGTYNFHFYELGFHRVARCKNTGIMIDSSSSQGAFILREGGWDTFTGIAKWRWNPRRSRFEKTTTSGESRLVRPVTIHQRSIHLRRTPHPYLLIIAGSL